MFLGFTGWWKIRSADQCIDDGKPKHQVTFFMQPRLRSHCSVFIFIRVCCWKRRRSFTLLHFQMNILRMLTSFLKRNLLLVAVKRAPILSFLAILINLGVFKCIRFYHCIWKGPFSQLCECERKAKTDKFRSVFIWIRSFVNRASLFIYSWLRLFLILVIFKLPLH